MTSAGLQELGRDLGRLFREGSLSGASDARLLEWFVTEGDASAFEALVARYRGMLLRTCHEILGDPADADEAFQATLVILVRRADSIRERDSVEGWLHRVACRTARRIRSEAAKRRASEGRAVALRASDVNRSEPDPIVREEIRAALHEEIDRLPERYRRPLILCHLEGMTQEDAAARLGWTEGSVRGRLARAKGKLRSRLTRRGIALAAVLAELAEPGLASARPFVGGLLMKAAGVLLVALIAIGVVMLRENPPKPRVPATSVVVVPRDEPEPEALASFRGGGPTNESRANALPPEVAARTVDFRGRVLDPSGKGVAGARLSLVTDAWSVPAPEAVSGVDGSFQFTKTIGDFWRNFAQGGVATPYVQAVVLATHESFGAAWVNLRVVAKDGKPAIGGAYPITLRMVVDRPIEGRLLDDKGRPIAGALVRVDQLYAMPNSDLSPILDALRKFDLAPYQRTQPRIWPNNLAASMAIPPATTGPDGRFRLNGVGRDRQANLSATGPGMASMSWTVLNRDDANEVTKAVRDRWPHRSSPVVQPLTKAVPNRTKAPEIQVYGPTFDLVVAPAPTIQGVVRDAATGEPVAGAVVYNAVSDQATTDEAGRYRIIRHDDSDRLWLMVRPPDGKPLLGAAREFDGVRASREFTADFGLARGLHINGRAVERGTGRPMLATRSEGCHGAGPIMGGRVWYRPLAGNASLTGNETGAYFQHAVLNHQGLYVGLVENDGVFRGVVPPGPGVLLLEAMPGMPFMWEFTLPWKERDGYHHRFPYAPLTHREPNDGAPPGEALPGLSGPIRLDEFVAYRVINIGANEASSRIEITIPTAATRRVRFVDSDGRPVVGVKVTGLNATFLAQVILDGSEVEVLALHPTQERRLDAVSPDGRLGSETTLRGDSAEPITIRMTRRSLPQGNGTASNVNGTSTASPTTPK